VAIAPVESRDRPPVNHWVARQRSGAAAISWPVIARRATTELVLRRQEVEYLLFDDVC
jgi:hypothetical protein